VYFNVAKQSIFPQFGLGEVCGLRLLSCLICVVHRKLLVFGGGVSTGAEDRLLHPAVVHPVAADRRVIVGRLLDQQELGPGASVSGSDHRPNDDDNSCDVEAR